MKAEYVCGKDGWVTRWRCIRCEKPLVRDLGTRVMFIHALCDLCKHTLLNPVEIWSQHSYGVGIDVNS